MGLWGFHRDFRMDSKLRGNELNTALVIASYVYSNNHNTANNNDLSVIPPGSRDYRFPNPESQD